MVIEEAASGEPGGSEFCVVLPLEVDEQADSFPVDSDSVRESSRLEEGFVNPHLWHSQGCSDLPRAEREDALMPTQSAWCQVSQVSHKMLDLAPL